MAKSKKTPKTKKPTTAKPAGGGLGPNLPGGRLKPKGRPMGRVLPGKLIVIPPPSFAPLGGGLGEDLPGANALGGGLGPDLPSAAGAARRAGTPSLAGLLAQRRNRLLSFARSIRASATGLKTLGLAASTAARRTPARAAVAASAAAASITQPAIKCLEGLGVLIVDEETVDRSALEASTGARILENMLVPLVQARRGGGAVQSVPWHLDHINIAAARAQGLEGAGQLVGVLDTGIDADHPEFHGKTIHFAEFDEDGSLISSTPRDAGEHGTHVSAIIAGQTAGVAPKAELAVAAVLTIESDEGLSGSLAQIFEGLNWLLTTDFTGNATSPGVDVLNASLGGGAYHNYLYAPLANARQITGTVMAAAIGNAGPQQNRHGSPGNYDIAVGVGAVDQASQIASFSDWGTVSQHGGLRKPDLCAPGVRVVSAIPGGTMAPMSGTSMASPVVAGVLALLLEQNPELSLDASALIDRLYALLRPLSGASNRRRGGRGELDLTAI